MQPIKYFLFGESFIVEGVQIEAEFLKWMINIKCDWTNVEMLLSTYNYLRIGFHLLRQKLRSTNLIRQKIHFQNILNSSTFIISCITSLYTTIQFKTNWLIVLSKNVGKSNASDRGVVTQLRCAPFIPCLFSNKAQAVSFRTLHFCVLNVDFCSKNVNRRKRCKSYWMV